MILELKGIYKEYLQGKMKVPVLKDVNFSMEEGEYVAIMGPSGSGKTTLMNIIGCLDKQTEGTFFLDGQDIKACSENAMSDIRLNKIGFVFQSFHLLPKQSALANVEMPLNYAKVPKKERRERELLTEWACQTELILNPISYLVVRCSELPLRELLSITQSFFWQMSQQVLLTVSPGHRLWNFSRN